MSLAGCRVPPSILSPVVRWCVRSRTSEPGHEMRFEVNYLAGYALTRRLLPLLERSEPARVGERGVDVAGFERFRRSHADARLFCQPRIPAEQACLLVTLDLAREPGDTRVTVAAVHPASRMDTPMIREAGVEPWSTVDEGADAVMRVIVGDDAKTATFYNGLRVGSADAQAYEASARNRLRVLSEQLTGIRRKRP